MSSLRRERAEGKLSGGDLASGLLHKCLLILLYLKRGSLFLIHSSVLWFKTHLKDERTTFSQHPHMFVTH